VARVDEIEIKELGRPAFCKWHLRMLSDFVDEHRRSLLPEKSR
jgi:hypothetical protein